MLKAPSTMISGHRKASIQMEPRSRKDAWIQKEGRPCASQRLRKKISSQATDLHCHATALYHLWEELLKEQ